MDPTLTPAPATSERVAHTAPVPPPAPARGFLRRYLPVAGMCLGALAVVIALGVWLRTLPSVAEFIARYPGVVPPPSWAPVGVPAWLAAEHFLNTLFLVLIVRTGWVLRRHAKPAVFWRRDNTRFPRTRRAPRRIGLDLWFHLALDALWVLNGIVYVVLLAATGSWVRLVPTRWDAVPNALSAAIQYASLAWPHHDGWTGYNALQQLAYLAVVMLLAPAAILTGLRMSAVWPSEGALARAFPERWARALHYPVLWAFVIFVVAHVTLVATTNVLANLDAMYAARPGTSWIGAGIFGGSLLVIAAAWVAARPAALARIARQYGQTWG